MKRLKLFVAIILIIVLCLGVFVCCNQNKPTVLPEVTTATPMPTDTLTQPPITPVPTITPIPLFIPDIQTPKLNNKVGSEQLEYLAGSKNYSIDFSELDESYESFTVRNTHFAGELLLIGATSVPLSLDFPFATIKVEGEFNELTLTSGENTNIISKNAKVENLIINGGNVVVTNFATIEMLRIQADRVMVSMSDNTALKLVASEKNVKVRVNDSSSLTLMLNSNVSEIAVNHNSKQNCKIEKDGDFNTNVVVVPKTTQNKIEIEDVLIAKKITINNNSESDTVDKFFDTELLTAENVEKIIDTVKVVSSIEEDYVVAKFLNDADYLSKVGTQVSDAIPYRNAMSFDVNRKFSQSDLDDSTLISTYFINIDKSKLAFLENNDTMTLLKNGLAVSTFTYNGNSFGAQTPNSFNLGQYFGEEAVQLAFDIPFALKDNAGVFRAAVADYSLEFNRATNAYKLDLQKNYSGLIIETMASINVSTFEMLSVVLRDSNYKIINIIDDIAITNTLLIDNGVEVQRGENGRLIVNKKETVIVLNGGKLDSSLISPTVVSVTNLFGQAYYASFADAITYADNGDRINLNEGEYSLDNTSYTVNKAISIKGLGANKTKITTPIKYVLPNNITKASQNKIVLEGISFYNDGDTSKHYSITTESKLVNKYMLDVSTLNTFSKIQGNENELDAVIIRNCNFETVAQLSYGINLDAKTNLTLENSKFITTKKDVDVNEGYFQQLVAFPASGNKDINSNHIIKNNIFACKFVYGFYFLDKVDMTGNDITCTINESDTAYEAEIKKEVVDAIEKTSVKLGKIDAKHIEINKNPVLLHLYASKDSENYDSVTANILNNSFSGVQSVIRLYNLDYTNDTEGFIFRGNKMADIGTPLNLSTLSYSGGGSLLSKIIDSSNTIERKKIDYKDVVAFLESGASLKIDKNVAAKRGGAFASATKQGILYYSFSGTDEGRVYYDVEEFNKKVEGTYYFPHSCLSAPCAHVADNNTVFAYDKKPELLFDKIDSYENELGTYIYLGKHATILNTFNNKLNNTNFVVSSNPTFVAHTFVKEGTNDLYIVPHTVKGENFALIKAPAEALKIDANSNIYYGTDIKQDGNSVTLKDTVKVGADIDVINANGQFETLIIGNNVDQVDEDSYQIILPNGKKIRNLNIFGDFENVIINTNIENINIKKTTNLIIKEGAVVTFIELSRNGKNANSVINNYGTINGKIVTTHNIAINAEAKVTINNHNLINGSIYIGGWVGNAGGRLASLKASGSVINNYKFINAINLFGQATVNNGQKDKNYNFNQPQNVKNITADVGYTEESPFAPVINKFVVTAHVENYLVSREALSAGSTVNNYARMANYADGSININARTDFNNYGVIGTKYRDKNYNLAVNGGTPGNLGTISDANNYGGAITIGYAGYYDYCRGTKLINEGIIYYASALGTNSKGTFDARLPQAPLRIMGMRSDALTSENHAVRYSGKPIEINVVNRGVLYGGMYDGFAATNTLDVSFVNEENAFVTLITNKMFYSNIMSVTNRGIVWVESEKFLDKNTGNLFNPIKNEANGKIVKEKPAQLVN